MEGCYNPVQANDLKRAAGRKRIVTTEAYFTADSLAERCVKFLSELVPLEAFSSILEPSAGAGAFVRALRGSPVIAIDLNPGAPGIERLDFFRYEPPCFEPNLLVIGNPPFGQRGALAMRFMEKATTFASVVAFILPRSFKKHTFLNRIDPWFHLEGQFDCDEFVLPDGTPTTVNCVFQVWRRRATRRELVELPAEHEDFEMKHFHLSRTSPEEFARAQSTFDFAIPQVGANFAPKRISDLAGGSYWFIKVQSATVADVFHRLDFAFLDGLNTAHKSLSKRDIIQAYENAAAGQAS